MSNEVIGGSPYNQLSQAMTPTGLSVPPPMPPPPMQTQELGFGHGAPPISPPFLGPNSATPFFPGAPPGFFQQQQFPIDSYEAARRLNGRRFYGSIYGAGAAPVLGPAVVGPPIIGAPYMSPYDNPYNGYNPYGPVLPIY